MSPRDPSYFLRRRRERLEREAEQIVRLELERVRRAYAMAGMGRL